MNRPNLGELLRQSARKAEEERDFQAHVARVAAIAKPDIEKILAQYKAESAREITCPHCNEKFTVSYRTDDVTSDTDNDDPDNDQTMMTTQTTTTGPSHD